MVVRHGQQVTLPSLKGSAPRSDVAASQEGATMPLTTSDRVSLVRNRGQAQSLRASTDKIHTDLHNSMMVYRNERHKVTQELSHLRSQIPQLVSTPPNARLTSHPVTSHESKTQEANSSNQRAPKGKLKPIDKSKNKVKSQVSRSTRDMTRRQDNTSSVRSDSSTSYPNSHVSANENIIKKDNKKESVKSGETKQERMVSRARTRHASKSPTPPLQPQHDNQLTDKEETNPSSFITQSDKFKSKRESKSVSFAPDVKNINREDKEGRSRLSRSVIGLKLPAVEGTEQLPAVVEKYMIHSLPILPRIQLRPSLDDTTDDPSQVSANVIFIREMRLKAMAATDARVTSRRPSSQNSGASSESTNESYPKIEDFIPAKREVTAQKRTKRRRKLKEAGKEKNTSLAQMMQSLKQRMRENEMETVETSTEDAHQFTDQTSTRKTSTDNNTTPFHLKPYLQKPHRLHRDVVQHKL